MGTVTVNICGDFVSKGERSIKISSSLREKLSEGDINVVNFEAPLSGYGTMENRSGPKLSQPVTICDFLKKSGFNLFQLANNHAVDFGETACKATKEQLDVVVGAGSLDEAYSPLIKNINGIKIAFLSFAHHEFGVLDEFDTSRKIGTAWINSPRATRAVIDTKKIVDYLIVLTHAGVEQIEVPLPEWRRRYKEFIDFGADAIVGTHPHVPQGWEIYKGKPIFYSLGNFYFDAIMPPDEWWYKGLMVTFKISEKDVAFNVNNTSFSEGKLELDSNQARTEHNQYLVSLLADESAYISKVNEIAKKKWAELQLYFIRGLGACSFHLSFVEFLKAIYCMCFRKPNRSLFINALQCESHRELVLRAMRLENKLNLK